jgi:hypothetical protein
VLGVLDGKFEIGAESFLKLAALIHLLGMGYRKRNKTAKKTFFEEYFPTAESLYSKQTQRQSVKDAQTGLKLDSCMMSKILCHSGLERKNKREQKVHSRKSKQIFRFPSMKISLRCCCQAFGCTGRSETETLICTEGLRGEIETELECGQSTMYGCWKIAQKL